ncbi:MAG: hypothetical protein ACK5M4_15765 [Pseudorhodobacter sp.]
MATTEAWRVDSRNFLTMQAQSGRFLVAGIEKAMTNAPNSPEKPQKPARQRPTAKEMTRENRLKTALKANMARRKAQARARAEPKEQDE